MRRALLLPFLWFAACTSDEATSEPAAEDPPFVLAPESCAAPSVEAPRTFTSCSDGSGSFGRWTVDDLGLPAYEYAIDQAKEPFAVYPTTDGIEHREHFHQFGNRRVTAIFVNDGYVQLGTQDRGATWLNAFDAEAKNYAGGFSYVDDGSGKWSSAYAFRAKPSITVRRFGTTYAETSTRHGDIEIHRRVFAPSGDATALIDEVTVTNHGGSARTVRHYEYWDVARRQIQTSWLASGSAAAVVPGNLVRSRNALNRFFDESSSYDAGNKLLRVTRKVSAEGATKLPSKDAISDLDVVPGDPYLAALVGDVAEVWTDQAAFFGDGDATLPDAVKNKTKGALGAAANGNGQPFAFVMATDLALGPGESKPLRFAYGYSPMGTAPTIDPRWRDPAADLRKETTNAIRDKLVYFASDREPWLQREMAWHAATIQQSVCFREYWGRHVVPQGSAYLWLHGADGAARDQALFSLPLTYIDPALAREQLVFLMSITHRENARMTYAFQGHGVLDNALIHTAPSDLYVFFLLAMTEYLEATGDTSLLDELVPFHPKESESASGFEHVRRGVRHLFDVVGTGPHGLIRVQTGDWSDGIVASEAKDRDLAIKDGESIPNTQMAVWVLPRAAKWIRVRDAALATELESKAAALKTALDGEWLGDHYRRAYLGGDQKFDGLTLEAQVWALIADILDAAKRNTLIDTIESKLARTAIGPAMFAGEKDAGDVWPAIADLLPWGYAVHGREDLAWNTFARVTLHAHAKAFPEMWAGIWSAADGHFAEKGGQAPGAAWSSVVTPMLDWPVHNNNAHTMPILALLRLAGVEPIDGGLRIAPKIPGRTFALDTNLLKVDVRPKSIRVEYRPTVDGKRTIEIELGVPITRATLDGAPVTPDGTRARFDVTTAKGKPAVLVVE